MKNGNIDNRLFLILFVVSVLVAFVLTSHCERKDRERLDRVKREFDEMNAKIDADLDAACLEIYGMTIKEYETFQRFKRAERLRLKARQELADEAEFERIKAIAEKAEAERNLHRSP